MDPFLVTLYEEPGCIVPLYFDCHADDADHAAEQAEDAYPGCEILRIDGMAVMEAA